MPYKDKMPPPSKMDKWIVRKGLKGVRGKDGKFISRKCFTIYDCKKYLQQRNQTKFVFYKAISESI